MPDISPPHPTNHHRFSPPSGCCWAFGGVSAASDRACISTNGSIAVPFSAQDTCFNAERSGCNGGQVETPWTFFKKTGVVTGTQVLGDSVTPKTDPFDGEDLCAAWSLLRGLERVWSDEIQFG